ncbi:MAG: hypothetical protein V1773_04925 [bacterium]
MDIILLWIGFVWSILSLIISLILVGKNRISKNSKKNDLFLRNFQVKNSSFKFLIKYSYILSNYNLRVFLSSFLLFEEMKIAKNNYFVRAFIYDHSVRISRNNLLVNCFLGTNTQNELSDE